MTTATAKSTRTVDATKPAMPPQKSPHATHHVGRDVGKLTVNAYERGINDIVAFEKDAAKVTPYPWMKSTLALSADLIEEVGAAYVKTARQILK